MAHYNKWCNKETFFTNQTCHKNVYQVEKRASIACKSLECFGWQKELRVIILLLYLCSFVKHLCHMLPPCWNFKHVYDCVSLGNQSDELIVSWWGSLMPEKQIYWRKKKSSAAGLWPQTPPTLPQPAVTFCLIHPHFIFFYCILMFTFFLIS